MYQIEVQNRDHSVEVLEKDLPSYEEAEYALAEIMLKATDPLPSYYIKRMGPPEIVTVKRETEDAQISGSSTIIF